MWRVPFLLTVVIAFSPVRPMRLEAVLAAWRGLGLKSASPAYADSTARAKPAGAIEYFTSDSTCKIRRAFLSELALAVLFLVVLFFSSSPQAAGCSWGGGSLGSCSNEGEFDYDSTNKVFFFCNGTDKISVGSASNYGACSSEGELDYDATQGNYKFCDGTNWIAAANNGTSGSCSNVGEREYDYTTHNLKWCNGSTWIDMADSGTSANCIFVTSTTYLGKVGGVGSTANANSLCAGRATAAGLTGTYKAWISDSTTSASANNSHPTIPYAIPPDGDDMKIVGTVTDATKLNHPRGISVSGSYAYVIGNTGDSLAVVNVSNPAAPTVSGWVTDSGLNGAWGVSVSGNYAYVGARVNDALTVVDISNPAAPTVSGTVSDSTNMNSPYDVVISGSYAYVAANFDNKLTKVDISNPAAPAVVGVITDATKLSDAKGVAISASGNYLYVSAPLGNGLTVVQIAGVIPNTVVADNWTDLTDGTLDNPLNKDEFGATTANAAVWTGTTSAGALDDDTCTNWTSTVTQSGSTSETTGGDVGDPASATATWTAGGNYKCGASWPIYCLEQSSCAEVSSLSFTDQTNIALSAVTDSNIVQIPVSATCNKTVSTAGDASRKFRICSNSDCSTEVFTWGSTSQTVVPGQYVQQRVTSSASTSTAITATLTVGAYTAPAWSVTTTSGGCTEVSSLSFTNQTGVALSTETDSNIVQIPVSATCNKTVSTAGDASRKFRICSNSDCSTEVFTWGSTSQTVVPGQYVQQRVTSSAIDNTTRTSILTVSAYTAPAWNVTTVVMPRTVFVTSTSYLGNTNIATADAACQARSTAVGSLAPAGTYKAWLAITTGVDDPDTRFTHSASPYRTVDGTTIANDWNDLTDGTLIAGINLTELGVVANLLSIWTNVAIAGTATTSGSSQGNNCTAWTSSSGGLNKGNYGTSNKADSLWTANSNLGCGSSVRLYCFQQ